MHKSHVTLVALLVAVAAVFGAIAVTRTTGLGSAARHANDASVTSQSRQLAAFAAKLRQELKAKPPALPKVPKQAPAAAQPVAAAPQIVYHRPPPVVHVVHHRGDDGSAESEGGGGGDG